MIKYKVNNQEKIKYLEKMQTFVAKSKVWFVCRNHHYCISKRDLL